MIDGYSFGRIVIAGITYRSDLKIVTGKVVPDWWRNAGHAVGKDDVGDILAAAPQYFVIGQGNPGLMTVTADFAAELARLGIELIEEPTAQAITTFNRLYEAGKNVAAGFHLTC
ncbi:MAG: MTH938/NDUFAF3 family protein [Pseudomonadota bacterium]